MAGTKYWVYIVAPQDGIPDWGISVGTGGDGMHFRRIHQDGDVYQIHSVRRPGTIEVRQPEGPNL